VSKGITLKTLTGHTDWVTLLVVLPDGSLASARASYDKTIRVWDVSKGITLKTLTGHTDWVTSLVVLPDGSLASASFDETIRVWNDNN